MPLVKVEKLKGKNNASGKLAKLILLTTVSTVC